MPACATTDRTLALLREQQALPAGVLETLEGRAALRRQWVGRVIVEQALLTDEALARLLAAHYRLEVVDPVACRPDARALACLPPECCRAAQAVPISLQDADLHLAVVNPCDGIPDVLAPYLRDYRVTLVVAPLTALDAALDHWYQPTVQAAPADAAAPRREARQEMHEFLCQLVQRQGSDLHLTVGMRPLLRLHGRLHPLSAPVLTSEHADALIDALLTREQAERFAEEWELDLAYILPGVARFRASIFRQNGHAGAVFRAVPLQVLTLEQLTMPPVLRELTTRARGLVLVTGPTGMGKSTTLAAMVEEINRARQAHIITIEDPIEFLYTPKNCEVNQRQIGTDTKNVATALRHALRQDPDVILIGEMRDLETIAAAITAAETGHLILSTLHTASAVQTIDRIIDVFPPHQQNQIRMQLAIVLEGVVTQQLLPAAHGNGRVCAQEVLLATPAVRNLIREGKNHLIPSVMQSSSKTGMRLMDQSLHELVSAGLLSLQDAAAAAEHPEDFPTSAAA